MPQAKAKKSAGRSAKSGEKSDGKRDEKHEKLFAELSEMLNERVRPFIQMDGGDLEILELTPENVLKLRLNGACVGCPASSITLEHGIQQAINEAFPEEDIQTLLVME